MRVLMLTTDLELGGVERTIINRVHCLRREGVECAVAGLFAGGGGRGRAAALLEEEGVEVFCAGMRKVADMWRLAGLWRRHMTWQPDVLHCHLFHGHVAGALLRLAGVRAPMVWSYHSVVEPAGAARRVFYRLLSDVADAHVYVSEAVRRYQRALARPAARGEIIHNGSDLAPFLRLTPRPGPIFGAMGRLTLGHKGFDVLIRAFGRLARQRADARLRIAGDGPERAALQELIEAEGLAERAELVGFVGDVAAFLAGVNVFVNPSRWEAFGNTLVEGMAAGLPCIASRVGGLPEIGGDLVRWVRPGDVQDLYGALRETAHVRPSPQQVARQRRRMVERFSREKMSRSYLRVYRRLLRCCSGASGC